MIFEIISKALTFKTHYAIADRRYYFQYTICILNDRLTRTDCDLLMGCIQPHINHFTKIILQFLFLEFNNNNKKKKRILYKGHKIYNARNYPTKSVIFFFILTKFIFQFFLARRRRCLIYTVFGDVFVLVLHNHFFFFFWLTCY